MMTDYGDHGWGMVWWIVIGLIIVIAVVWIVVKSTHKTNNAQQTSGKSPLEILKERYASGELSKEEFEERRKTLMR